MEASTLLVTGSHSWLGVSDRMSLMTGVTHDYDTGSGAVEIDLPRIACNNDATT